MISSSMNASGKETSSLLESARNSSKSRRRAKQPCWTVCFNYRVNWTLNSSKSAALVLVMVGLVHTFDPNIVLSMANLSYKDHDLLVAIYSGSSIFFYLFYPILGLYADINFGRYLTGITSLVLSFFTCLLIVVGTLLYGFHESTALGLALFILGFILGNFTRTSFMIVMLSFGVDQLQGASGEELSAFMHWFYFCFIAGWAVSVPIICSVENIDQSIFAMYGAHMLCVSVAILIMVCFRKHMVVTEPQVNTNPVKTIVKVLKYAKNHYYPENRSALTYWENDYPSRLDLGNEKYGGPFTEDQVQDVKTLLRIIPIIVCMLVFFVMADGYQFLPQPMESEYAHCLMSSVYFINCIVMITVILLNQLILYPMFYRHYPSMLKKIGLGIFLCLLAQATWLVIDVASPTTTEECVLSNLFNKTFYWDIDNSLMVIPRIIGGVGFGTVAPTTLEFAFAQAPYSMRGVIVGIWFMTTGFLKTIGFSLIYPFKQLGDGLKPPCEFYLFVTNFLIIFLSFLCFICLAYWYKLRFRGDRFEQHQTVEKMYTKYLEYDSKKTLQNCTFKRHQSC